MHGLYLVTPDWDDTAALLARTEAALGAGVALLQDRHKTASPELRREQATALLALCRRHGVPFIVNDDIELALAIGADGVHLGRDDGELALARSKLKGKLVGASCYNRPELARAAIAAGADYVAFGSVFSSPTKPAAVRAPLSLFNDFPVPLCAIGGITLQNAPQVIAAGADMLAVISDLFDAPDIARHRLKGKLLGASCYNRPELARAAIAAGADYVAFGSVFSSLTKPAAVRAPLSLFSDFPIPRCAIGGITLQNAPQVIAAGADMLAVISDLFDAPDIARQAGAYRKLFP